MKKVLLTGATGFIGRHAIRHLLNTGYEVHATSSHPQPANQNVQWHQCDLLDSNKTSQLLNEIQPSHLLHFAWYATPGKYWTSTLNIDWVKASLHLLQEFAKNGGKRIVISGTCAEYDWTDGICDEDKTVLVPMSLYGTCKVALYQMAMAFAKQEGLSCAWGRIFHLYGPHEYPERLTPAVIQSLLRNEVARCSHGTQIRDYLHVDDVADAFVAILNSESQGAINIGSGEQITLKEMIEKIAIKLNAQHNVQYGAMVSRALDPQKLYGNTNRLFNELKWRPKYTLDDGLTQTIDWWKAKM